MPLDLTADMPKPRVRLCRYCRWGYKPNADGKHLVVLRRLRPSIVERPCAYGPPTRSVPPPCPLT
jgi:hypothetical protein